MNERLTQFLAAEQLTPARFAEMLGVQPSGVSHILSGRNKPGYDFLEKFIKRFPAVNIEWLIAGRGKMYKEMQTASLFPAASEEIPVANPDLFSTATTEPYAPDNKKEPLPEDEKSCNNDRGKTVERVIVFYTDKTFLAYSPE